jgi:hypothetical protein
MTVGNLFREKKIILQKTGIQLVESWWWFA